MNRVKFPLPQPLPDTPIRGVNIRPINFGDPALKRLALAARRRAGSRWAVIKPKRKSVGILWRGRPFYWSEKGYYRGGQNGKRRQLQHVIWEHARRRKMPRGHEIFFRDRDRHNFNISNMEMLSKAELHRRIIQIGEHTQPTLEVRCIARQRIWTRKSRERVDLLLKSFQQKDKHDDKIKFLARRRHIITHGPGI